MSTSDSAIGELLASVGSGTRDNPGGMQESIKLFAAALTKIEDSVEREIVIQAGKATVASALAIAPRDAERILTQAMQHPIGEHADDPFGRVYTLHDLEAHPEWLEVPEPAIPYLAWPGLKTLFSAREKAGKSTLAMAGAAAASAGREFLGALVAPRRVLWVSEEPIGVMIRRAKEMAVDPDRFVMLPMTREPLAQLAHHAQATRADLVVIDTLYRLGVGYVTDENDSVQWGPVFNELDKITRAGRALLLLTHSTKKSKSGEYRGSTAIGGWVDVLVNMKTPSRDDLARKLEPVGRIPTAPITVKRTTDGFDLVEGGNKLDHTGPLADQVLAFVSTHPGSSKTAIRNALPFRNTDVDAAIGQLVLDERLTKEVSHGRNSYTVRATFPLPETGSQFGEDGRDA